MFTKEDHDWMEYALRLAAHAKNQDEVPVGAVLVIDNQKIGEGSNAPISKTDPTAHAEIQALREGAKNLKNYRLNQSTLYVTLEPCVMCVGAIMQARVLRVVFGAHDARYGSLDFLKNYPFNHSVIWEGGLLADRCGGMLTEFFRLKRG